MKFHDLKFGPVFPNTAYQIKPVSELNLPWDPSSSILAFEIRHVIFTSSFIKKKKGKGKHGARDVASSGVKYLSSKYEALVSIHSNT